MRSLKLLLNSILQYISKYVKITPNLYFRMCHKSNKNKNKNF